MNEDLKRERSHTSFNTKELSAILYGGAENHSRFKRLGMYKGHLLYCALSFICGHAIYTLSSELGNVKNYFYGDKLTSDQC